jgi:hypothetical protein
VSALELAVFERYSERLAGKYNTAFEEFIKDMKMPQKLLLGVSMLRVVDAAQVDTAEKAIETRNKIAHKGVVPSDSAQTRQELWTLLNVVKIILPNAPLKFPSGI